MDSDRFWAELEYRVCREIDGLSGVEFKYDWCDGFIPDEFEIQEGQPVMTGVVWMAQTKTSHQEPWRFSLILPQSVRRLEDVDWSALLPAEDVTGWLSLDRANQTMKIDPLAAYPDRGS